MNVSMKFIRTSIALSACLGLLAACGDRGQFQARTFTDKERQEFATKQKLAQQGSPDSPVNTQPAPEVEAGAGTTPDPKSTPKPIDVPPVGGTPAPADKKAEIVSPGAANKVLIETIQDRDKFIEQNLSMVSALDQAAVDTIKGITFTVTGLQLEVNAAIVIGKDLRHLNILNLMAYSKDGKIAPIDIDRMILKESAEQDAKKTDLTNQVVAYAVCKDTDCTEIHVRLQILADGGYVSGAFQVKKVDTQTYKAIASNLGDQLKDFESALVLFKPSIDPSTVKPADTKPAALPTDVVGVDPAAGKTDGEVQKTPPAAPADAPVTAPVTAPAAKADAAPAAPGIIADTTGKAASALLKPAAAPQLKLPEIQDQPAIVSAQAKPAAQVTAAPAPAPATTFSERVNQLKAESDAKSFGTAMAASQAAPTVSTQLAPAAAPAQTKSPDQVSKEIQALGSDIP